MTLIRHIFTLLFAIALCCNVNQSAASEKPMTVVTENLWPFNYLERGTVKGPHTDLVKQVLAASELDYSIAVLPWARAYKLATTEPNILIYTINRTNLRQEKFHWIARFPTDAEINFYALKKSKLTNSDLSTLKTLAIGTQIDTANDNFVTQNGFNNISRVSHVRQTIGMLKIGRVKLVIASDHQVKRAAQESGLDINELEKIGYAFSSVPSIAVSLKTPIATVEKLRATYKKLAQENDLCQLIDYGDLTCIKEMSKVQP